VEPEIDQDQHEPWLNHDQHEPRFHRARHGPRLMRDIRRREPFRVRHMAVGPLRRDPGDRLGGGVASGVAAWRGFNVTSVRIAFVLITVITSGIGVALYIAGWLLIPARDNDTSIAAKARGDAKGIALAIGLGTLLIFVLLIAGLFNDGWIDGWAWPQVFSAAGLILIWRNAPAEEQASLRHLIEPISAAATATATQARFTVIRLVIAGVLLIAGVSVLATAHESLALLRPLSAVALVVAAIVLFLGPWWLRIARDLVVERQARIRAEERADIAARVHDSVLQTLALIQRRADDPSKVVQLARLQERELRSWLFEGKAPGEDGDATTFAAAVRQIQEDVESRYGVPVEAVTVGDCHLDDNLNALLAAAREATVNAAKWSGASVISLFAEVEPGSIQLVVRDRGQGFDPAEVPPDRKGLAESIHGRMTRRGGSATVTSVKGGGTKVALTMPRTPAKTQPSTRSSA